MRQRVRCQSGGISDVPWAVGCVGMIAIGLGDGTGSHHNFTELVSGIIRVYAVANE